MSLSLSGWGAKGLQVRQGSDPSWLLLSTVTFPWYPQSPLPRINLARKISLSELIGNKTS